MNSEELKYISKTHEGLKFIHAPDIVLCQVARGVEVARDISEEALVLERLRDYLEDLSLERLREYL